MTDPGSAADPLFRRCAVGGCCVLLPRTARAVVCAYHGDHELIDTSTLGDPDPVYTVGEPRDPPARRTPTCAVRDCAFPSTGDDTVCRYHRMLEARGEIHLAQVPPYPGEAGTVYEIVGSGPGYGVQLVEPRER